MDYQQLLTAIRGLETGECPVAGPEAVPRIGVGGYLEIGADTYRVCGHDRYLDVRWSDFRRRKRQEWVHELTLLHLTTGRRIWVEWSCDDAPEMTETVQTLRLKDILFNGRPVSRRALEDIADAGSGVVYWHGRAFHYDEDETWAALYFRADSNTPLPVRMYEFVSSDEMYLTIEAWHADGERPMREAFVSRPLETGRVKVLQFGAGCTGGE